MEIEVKDPEKEVRKPKVNFPLQNINKSSFFLLQTISLSLEDRDAEELVLVLRGYFRLLTGRELEVARAAAVSSEEAEGASGGGGGYPPEELIDEDGGEGKIHKLSFSFLFLFLQLRPGRWPGAKKE